MQELGWNLIGKGAAAQARPKIRGTAAVDGILDETEIELSSLVGGEIEVDTSVELVGEK